ncbi:hypothetical protein IQ06DRAFT_301363 [Phaeosphaeriaceae sp. SRC1lsM3a]|nr:hypothetical protein IQ06DRAFT_301363 [Stagonospora sp. SRC1lsM3a]
MVDYNTLPVNDGLKPLLRAIGIRSFPEKKAQMVAILEEYDRLHPGHPAPSLPIPATQPRKKRTPKAPAEVTVPVAERTADASRLSRKRKEPPPRVQPKPQAKRAKSNGRITRSENGTEGSQDEEALMLDASDHETSEINTAGPAPTFRLFAIPEDEEYSTPQDSSQHDTRNTARKHVRAARGGAAKVQQISNNSATRAAAVGYPSSKSRAKRNTDPQKHDKQLEAIPKVVVQLSSRKGKANGTQSVPSKPAPVQNESNRRAAQRATKAGKTTAMGDKAEVRTSEQEEAVQEQAKVIPDGTESAVASPNPHSHDPNAEAIDDENPEPVDTEHAGTSKPKVETKAQKLANEMYLRREPGGYADPRIAEVWRVRQKTIMAPIDNYYEPGKKRAPKEQLQYLRYMERQREEAAKEGITIPKQDCKSPPRKLDDDMLIDFPGSRRYK